MCNIVLSALGVGILWQTLLSEYLKGNQAICSTSTPNKVGKFILVFVFGFYWLSRNSASVLVTDRPDFDSFCLMLVGGLYFAAYSL